jgi:hypothetical protein
MPNEGITSKAWEPSTGCTRQSLTLAHQNPGSKKTQHVHGGPLGIC